MANNFAPTVPSDSPTSTKSLTSALASMSQVNQNVSSFIRTFRRRRFVEFFVVSKDVSAFLRTFLIF
jgi:hypothetical protein